MSCLGTGFSTESWRSWTSYNSRHLGVAVPGAAFHAPPLMIPFLETKRAQEYTKLLPDSPPSLTFSCSCVQPSCSSGSWPRLTAMQRAVKPSQHPFRFYLPSPRPSTQLPKTLGPTPQNPGPTPPPLHLRGLHCQQRGVPCQPALS